MRPTSVVELDVPADSGACLAHALVSMRVHVLVLDRAPQPLDEHLVSPAALAVHWDVDAVVGERPREGRTCELGGFNWLSQHRVVERILDTRSRSQPVSSNPAFYAGDAAKNLDCLRHEPQASSVVDGTARAQGHFDPLLVVPADVRVQGLDELLDGRRLPITRIEPFGL